MNYRHIYHAGNFADCLKHITLSRILLYLQKKDKPYYTLDTHAGIGLYDLSSEEAQKTGEWNGGIGKLIGPSSDPLPPEIATLCAPFLDVIKMLNPDGQMRSYPGSPEIVQTMCREQDRAFFIELHPDDFDLLSDNCGRDRRFFLREDDGWSALRSDLPPLERRGLVLIDPPYEEPDEYTYMVEQFLEGYKRWSTGIYCMWYPIKARRDVDVAAQMIADAGIPNALRAEIIINKLDTAHRLNGTGLFIINPPYTLHDELAVLLPFLAKRFGLTAQRSSLEWITPPK
ncbi:23S rRNA (adenine(2030)-N(6))-methyltransferase RlmJ [Cohaesibacter celericrescens]|uniref:Ribosomal RNA large subunit methyltransferase J n=1 Tax=Cohaesibacter celericrescens TaxID=2067669 RepID=A0A2N5XXE5_9HYPH|nr:23S rRNA (adenine(2030)-N(6))-methyltransferase RlmJ [Cohaesibacter celericrescens]PLW79137.1 23S rRNA (adenine(2030)-N(6))-methyltransferase RlmJ [Cohaesibacter celericrescens]